MQRVRAMFVTTQGPATGLIWLLYLVWLPFLIPSLLALPQARLTSGALVVLLLGVALFVALYAWTGWDNARHVTATALDTRTPWQMWLPIVVLTALSFLLIWVFGEAWGTLFIFTSAITLGRLPPLRAFAALAAMLLLVLAGGLLHPHFDWPFIAQGLFTMTVVGIIVVSVMRSIRASILGNRALRVAREESTRLAVAEERLRFARDLHDLLGHSLSLIALKSELAGRLALTAPERAVSEIGDVEDAARQALAEVREAVAGYRQPSLTNELHAAQQILDAAGIVFTQVGDVPDVPTNIEAVLAWAVREGVTNVIRHSRARRCTISIACHAHRITLEVSDNGRAGAPAPKKAGNGLDGLAERAAVLGGQIETGPRAGGGFRLAVSLPVAGIAAQRERSEAPPSRSEEGEQGEQSAVDAARVEAS
ncbi:MAG: Two-component system sensor histidine kinase [Ktedonobacterales bacterium]|jgi:two-component system sensor histidine kinase DesK|nr:MAG: Two-component system sensor histidine kinase [Ktedonobacterales bacterium]